MIEKLELESVIDYAYPTDRKPSDTKLHNQYVTAFKLLCNGLNEIIDAINKLSEPGDVVLTNALGEVENDLGKWGVPLTQFAPTHAMEVNEEVRTERSEIKYTARTPNRGAVYNIVKPIEGSVSLNIGGIHVIDINTIHEAMAMRAVLDMYIKENYHE